MKKTVISQKTWSEFIGMQGYTKEGKPLMKCVAINLAAQGEKVTFKPKPGWADGKLVNPMVYDLWLEGVRF